METECDQGDTVKMGNMHEEFKEVNEVRDIIASIPNIYGDLTSLELGYERLLCEYQYSGIT